MNDPVIAGVEPDAVALVIKWEEGGSFAPKVYLDPAKIPTQGYGSIWRWSADGSSKVRVQVGDPDIDETEARRWLALEMQEVARSVDALVKVPISHSQRAALQSFTYNVGSGNLASSTLLRRLNAGDAEGAAAQFLLWDHAGGVELHGLFLRREDEETEFDSQSPPAAQHPPQPAPVPQAPLTADDLMAQELAQLGNA